MEHLRSRAFGNPERGRRVPAPHRTHPLHPGRGRKVSSAGPGSYVSHAMEKSIPLGYQCIPVSLRTTLGSGGRCDAGLPELRGTAAEGPVQRTMSTFKLFDPHNAGYVQDLYERYARNPNSVPEEWRNFFSKGIQEAVQSGLIVPEGLRINGGGPTVASAPPSAPPDADRSAAPETAEDRASEGTLSRQERDEFQEVKALLPLIARAAALIQAFRDHGHQLARIDPLGSEPPGHPQLDPSFFGTSLEELKRVPTSLVLDEGGDTPLSETLQRLQEIYCGTVGYQFEHLEEPEKIQWLWSEVESGIHQEPLDPEQRVTLLERLSQVEGLEKFLHRAYLGYKRFSVEGNDMLIPMLDAAVEDAARIGGRHVVLGMAHRGRLNVLAHLVGIEYRAILREFEGAPQNEGALAAANPGTGDVKYHHGARGTYELGDGGNIDVELVPNPSHLEFVNPVVMGITRALQLSGPEDGAEQDTSAVVPILIHGDAAFAAEGVVAETLNLARLRGYATGGTVHIIVNNQVGFTTTPGEGRSTRYASDLAKGYDIPVLHVNADDPEACLGAMRLAMAYRHRFKDDILIDLVGYRRHGHNEGDEPTYTQPTLYQRIESHPSVRTQWARKLEEEGVVDRSRVEAIGRSVSDTLQAAQEGVKVEAGQGEGSMMPPPPDDPEPVEVESSVPFSVLEEVNEASLHLPDGFSIHPKLGKQLEKRRTDFSEEKALDWAHAESLAFGSLVRDGIPVRLSGQDSERGTFSQRHMVLHDVETGERTLPLRSLRKGRFEIYNSPLSETAVLGFEYGHSVGADQDFVLWEAQFGDFVNVAQPIIDQFIASGRAKWGQVSRLTLLLPHGYEGQGPEHSSARLERFLQLCAEDNMRVAYPTTPAQYFHLLRRQALGSPQRPLVVMTPKSLLRHPAATSPVRALATGEFHRVIPDPKVDSPDEVHRLILCSGKFYYDLQGSALREKAPNAAVGRVEELYPFPAEEIEALVRQYPNLREVMWAQEEPRNMGALSFVGPRLRAVVPREVPLRYVARSERASPAEGRTKSHKAKQERIVQDALGPTEG